MQNTNITKNKHNSFKFFSNIEAASFILANELSIFFADEFEDLNTHHFTFKDAMQKATLRVLHSIAQKKDIFTIFPDAIPGFTIISYIKTESDIATPEAIDPELQLKLSDFSIINPILQKFFEKNNQQVILVEGEDLLLTCLPLADAKKYLQDWGIFVHHN